MPSADRVLRLLQGRSETLRGGVVSGKLRRVADLLYLDAQAVKLFRIDHGNSVRILGGEDMKTFLRSQQRVTLLLRGRVGHDNVFCQALQASHPFFAVQPANFFE